MRPAKQGRPAPSFVTAATVITLLLLAACGGPVNDPDAYAKLDQLIEEVRAATPVATQPAEVAEAFALGTTSTDVQRDLLKQELVGSVVEWDVRVYEVSLDEGLYKVTSQPIAIEAAEAVPLLRVVAFIKAMDPVEEEHLRALKTEDVIRIRGRVQGIVLRTIVEIWPAVVVEVPSATTGAVT